MKDNLTRYVISSSLLLLLGASLMNNTGRIALFDDIDFGRLCLVAQACGATSAGIVQGRLTLIENARDESAGGLACYKIKTPTATYYLEKSGAGLSSLLDKEGNDWISFHDKGGSGAAGEYRGFPNAVHRQDGNFFHPKNRATDPSTTRVLHAGPSRISIEARSGNGTWHGRWDFYLMHCTFTITRMPADYKYWILYEGTPGGQYDDTDWWMTSDRPRKHPLTERHEGDIPDPEWIAFGDARMDRSLLLIHHADDTHPDTFYQMQKKMTVFGFGRKGLTKFLDRTGESFSVALVESTDHKVLSDTARSVMRTADRAATRPLRGIDRWKRHFIDDLPERSMFVTAADLDGDGDTDLAAGGWWWQNTDGLSGNWKRHTIGEPLRNLACAHDFDGDNDVDILGTEGVGAAADHNFVWARNNGSGRFAILENIDYTGAGDFLQGCIVGRINGRLRVLLSWHRDGGGIYSLNVPDKPSTQKWTTTRLSETVSSPPQGEDLSLGDIDRDGDLDLLLGEKWLRNDGNAWPTFVLGKVTQGEPDRVDLADINADGRLDAVVSLENGTDVLWYEAPKDPTEKWTRHKIGVVAGQGFSMDTADFDTDGDPDVVVGEHRGPKNNRVVLFENTSDGAKWIEHVIDSGPKNQIDHHDGVQSVDIDGDGDLDLISIGWYNPKLWILENLAK